MEDQKKKDEGKERDKRKKGLEIIGKRGNNFRPHEERITHDDKKIT